MARHTHMTRINTTVFIIPINRLSTNIVARTRHTVIATRHRLSSISIKYATTDTITLSTDTSIAPRVTIHTTETKSFSIHESYLAANSSGALCIFFLENSTYEFILLDRNIHPMTFPANSPIATKH